MANIEGPFTIFGPTDVPDLTNFTTTRVSCKNAKAITYFLTATAWVDSADLDANNIEMPDGTIVSSGSSLASVPYGIDSISSWIGAPGILGIILPGTGQLLTAGSTYTPNHLSFPFSSIGMTGQAVGDITGLVVRAYVQY